MAGSFNPVSRPNWRLPADMVTTVGSISAISRPRLASLGRRAVVTAVGVALNRQTLIVKEPS
jgi:hypothetical protein